MINGLKGKSMNTLQVVLSERTMEAEQLRAKVRELESTTQHQQFLLDNSDASLNRWVQECFRLRNELTALKIHFGKAWE